MRFACWMSSPWGRGIRIVVGLALIAVGLFWVQGVTGWILAAFALLPITTGVANVCPVSPFLHLPFQGSKLHNC